MTAHIRLAASEGEELIDEAPVGLPEEASSDKSRPEQSRRDEMLGEAAPPLVAEPEDRAGGRANGSERPKKGALARVIAFARGGKAKGSGAPAIAGVGSAEAEGKPETDLGKRGDKDRGRGYDRRPRATALAAVASADGADGAGERARPKGGLGKAPRLRRLTPGERRRGACRGWSSQGRGEIRGGCGQAGKRGCWGRHDCRSGLRRDLRARTGRKPALRAGSRRRPWPNLVGRSLRVRERSRSSC